MTDTYVVRRSQTIHAAPEAVFERIADLREWDSWSPWADKDPNMATTYEGEPGTVGASSHWVGNRKVGEGRMTATSIDAPNSMEIDLEFVKPFKAQNQVELLVAPSPEGSEVTWRMTGRTTLMTKIMGIFKSMDDMVGPDFENGLSKLKQLVEA
jgi:hypothetical protein